MIDFLRHVQLSGSQLSFRLFYIPLVQCIYPVGSFEVLDGQHQPDSDEGEFYLRWFP